MENNKKETIGVCLSMLLFFTGCAILLYPMVHHIAAAHNFQQQSQTFLDMVDTVVQDTVPEDQSKNQQQEDNEALNNWHSRDRLQQKMHSYNRMIYENAQIDLTDEASYQAQSFDLIAEGMDTDIFAVLQIPRIDLQMPVYLGATQAHMAAGAAHMSYTSLPVGGINTNCVLAGHRGWKGAAYFLYVTRLKEGDLVTVTNLWETLTYRVVESRIIAPDDVKSILIQPGRDLLTLLTCHPPASGGKERYIVFCERVN